MTLLSRLNALIRLSVPLALPLLISLIPLTAFGQTITMENAAAGCGGRATLSITDPRPPTYHWEKDGRLVISVALFESGSEQIEPGSARVSVKGNLVTITYKFIDWEKDGELPIMCVWKTLVTFVVSALEPNSYFLLFASDTKDKFRVQGYMHINEPE
jgi:hypothetical protein